MIQIQWAICCRVQITVNPPFILKNWYDNELANDARWADYTTPPDSNAKQFECDLRAKALAQMHELKDAEPKFQSAYTELTAAIDALEKGDFQATISNAGKSYESVLKVILGVDTGNANDLTTQYMNRLLTVPDTMQASGFRTNVMMALPYIRNKSGSACCGLY
jgi:hypothetical protein